MLNMIHYKKLPFTELQEITMSIEAFQEFLSRIKHIQPQPSTSLY